MGYIHTGNKEIDVFLHGGYETDVITTIYGPAGSGKTLLVLMALKETAKNKKVIFIDTEGGFSVERLKQIDYDFEKTLNNIIFLKPYNFEEQNNAIQKIAEFANKNIGLIIIDTISMLYRLELGDKEAVSDTNRALGKQISFLSELARKKSIPVLITNQVYADFENKNNVNMVGGDLLKYGSKCLIELKKGKNIRIMEIKKHRYIKEGKELAFRIVEKGIEVVRKKKGFNLFS